jgi:hypothetical protein
VGYNDFKYAATAVELGASVDLPTLTISYSQFAYNEYAVNADNTSTELPELGSLAASCLYPYDEFFELQHDWFGSITGAGVSGASFDGLSDYLGQTIDDEDYPGLGEVYDDYTTIEPSTISDGDNDIPWTLFECSIPGTDIEVDFPVTPVQSDSFVSGDAISDAPLWTDTNESED